MEIDLRVVLGALKKWFWVPLILMVVLGLIGYQFARQQEITYTATSTIVVEQSLGSTVSTTTNGLPRQLSDSYDLLLSTQEFRQQIAEQANFTDIAGYQIEISTQGGSNLLNVLVTHQDPAGALTVANATVDVIIIDYASRSEERLSTTTQALNSELELMRVDRDSIEQEMTALEEADDTNSARYRELTNSIVRLDQRIADTEARNDRIRLDYQLDEPSLIPIKYSVPPTEPNNLRPELVAIIGSFIGALIGGVFILFWALANNVVRSTSDWSAQSGVNVLSEVPHAGPLDEGSRQVYLLTNPTAAPAESIRMLVTGLDFASFPSQGKSVLQVTSPGPANGKSTVAANLAVHFAQLGKRVVLVDCDLHRPTLHSIFTVPQDTGLTSLLRYRDTRVQDVAARVAVPGLFLIPSGPLVPNPAEMFSSIHFENLLHQLKVDFDIVILDTPPILLFSDSHRIASRSDAIMAVGRLGQTKLPDMDSALEAIETTGTDFLGAVWVGSKQKKDQYQYYRRNRRSGIGLGRLLGS